MCRGLCRLDRVASGHGPVEPEENSEKTWAAGALGCLGLLLSAFCLSRLLPPHLIPTPAPKATNLTGPALALSGVPL